MQDHLPLRVIAAGLGWFALGLQLVLSVQLAHELGKSTAWGVVNYLSYFTILTNLLVALALTVPMIAAGSPAGRFFARPGVATAIAAAITIVAVVYFVMLRNVWDPQGWQLVADSLLHYVMPALYLAWWWLAVPKHGLRFSHIGLWTLYPVAYLALLLIRGELTDIYPYPFVDVGLIGYGSALIHALMILGGYLLVSAGFVALARRAGIPRSRKTRSSEA